ncbi:hypothetical protein [Hymenobacter guriensis]|uniref:DUF4164 family protein n=1 Tax=Hymenobacter guriensis TaxID=2793065 RepID=A0ABS0L6Z1_9BACT|nr:hypothetical protein [Hymenobacter guriensis]MBG8555859.1 hypothetical protein [Hymenobacter guriensis]
MSHTPSPQHMRVPENLSDAHLRQALTELDEKIKTLRNRAHTTTANSSHTYHEHIAALEVKRAKLLERLGPADAASGTDQPDQANRSTWEEIWQGVENLRNDLRNLI